MYENTYPEKRYSKTLQFLLSNVQPPAKILDLGVENPFSEIMRKNGYHVSNTTGEDLDLVTDAVKTSKYEVVTAFEIFEHLLAPLNVLKDIQATKLVTTVPLKLWFSPAYQSKTDKWDRHYHEFEDWQFDWLLEKSGWHIKESIKWNNPVNKIGIRPILRKFTPRYYAVYAERI
ncbi:methyltransferase domain-containing protein [Gramella sp. AN32]|uniref:Methyltransferase domain-containing protein n=1 Tax=Christiangramia antarctica TaxID=2058158 RepID=A0ABW5X781_9FLAO|nr:methyltransferase domain-containing protein [Gramella sp. AN32]MCM4157484.1 methyltransferase [Gramella sp. AN32]